LGGAGAEATMRVRIEFAKGSSGTLGTRFCMPIDLSAVPQPSGLVSVLSGETWNFQA
jgi:hypothetical protein